MHPTASMAMAVGFGKTFFGLIRASVSGSDNPLINLEVWGAPISPPLHDPANSNFVYQRFQRGVMHFDATTGRTEGLLLADYLKAILRGRDLPNRPGAGGQEQQVLRPVLPRNTLDLSTQRPSRDRPDVRVRTGLGPGQLRGTPSALRRGGGCQHEEPRLGRRRRTGTDADRLSRRASVLPVR